MSGCPTMTVAQLLAGQQRFVDKTLFIKDFVEGNHRYLILRPPGFGKSTNLQLLQLFLSNLEPNEDLFKPYQIYQHKSFFKKHFGKYPVIYLGFKAVSNCQNFQDMKEKVWQVLRTEALRHDLPAFGYDLNDCNPPQSMDFFLSKFISGLKKRHEQPVYVLIDDYDAPLNSAFSKGFNREASDFFSTFYTKALKDNGDLHRSCIMGILGVNYLPINLKVCSALTELFSEYFGFNEDETEPFQSLEISHEGLLEWYGGYHIGGRNILNPASVLMSSDQKTLNCRIDRNVNKLFNMLFTQSSTVLHAVLCFLDDPKYKHEIRLPVFLDCRSRVKSTGEIWSFFVCYDYLKYEHKPDWVDCFGFVKIPNKQVREFWEGYIMGLYPSDVQDFLGGCADFEKAVMSQDMAQIYEGLTNLLTKLSIKDFPKDNPIHSLLFGAFWIMFRSVPNVSVSTDLQSNDAAPRAIVIEFEDKSMKLIVGARPSPRQHLLAEMARVACRHAIEGKQSHMLRPNDSALVIGISCHQKQVSPIYHGSVRYKKGQCPKLKDLKMYSPEGKSIPSGTHSDPGTTVEPAKKRRSI